MISGLRRRDVTARLGLGVLVLWLFGPLLLGRGVLFQRDATLYWLPQVESLLRVLSEGAYPVWNPYFEVGLPMLADPGYQVFYPPQWANLALPPSLVYAWFIAAHALFGAVGAFALGRRWGLDGLSSWGMAGVWLGCGPFQSLVSNNPQFAGASWIPWVFVALERLLESRTVRSAALLGAAAALQLLAGSGDLALMTAQFAALRAALWFVRTPAASVRPRVVFLLGVAATLALSLSAALWVPTLLVVRAGGRAQMDVGTSAYWSVHPASLVDLIVPSAVAELPLAETARQLLFEGREPFLPSLYLGAAALLVIPLALRGGGLRSVLLLAAFLFLVGTACGRHAPLHALVMKLPAASLFRYPPKYMVPAALFWAALVGLGLRVFQEDWPAAMRRFARRIVIVGSAGALALGCAALWISAHPDRLDGIVLDVRGAATALAGRCGRAAAALLLASLLLLARIWRPCLSPALTVAVVIVVVGDVLLAARGLNPHAPPELVRYRPPVLEAIAARRDGFPTRVLSLLDAASRLNQRVVSGPAGWDREWAWMLGLIDHLAPPTGARWGLGGGYDGDFTGLAPPALSAYSAVIRHPRSGDLGLALALLRAGGIDYVVSLQPEVLGLEALAAVPSVYDAPVRLFRVPEAPRVALARARYVPHAPAAWERLAAPDFDPAREVVLVGPESSWVGSPPGRLTVVARRSDRIEVEVDALDAAHVVLTEMRAPGWAAFVDGTPVPVATANLLFCAVPVSAGHHRVVFEYRPPGARAGLIVTGLGLFVLGSILLSAVRGRPSVSERSA